MQASHRRAYFARGEMRDMPTHSGQTGRSILIARAGGDTLLEIVEAAEGPLETSRCTLRGGAVPVGQRLPGTPRPGDGGPGAARFAQRDQLGGDCPGGRFVAERPGAWAGGRGQIASEHSADHGALDLGPLWVARTYDGRVRAMGLQRLRQRIFHCAGRDEPDVPRNGGIIGPRHVHPPGMLQAL
jgi:hypothetical protein